MRRFMTILTAGAAALSIAGCRCGETTTETHARVDVQTEQECGAYVLIPAKYETVTEQVMTSQPSVTKQQIEAKYEVVKDTVIDQPGHWKECNTPAEYKTVSEQVLVKPGHKEWRKVDCTKVEINPGEQRGDGYCLVDVPPVYENRAKQVLCTEACSRREWVAPTTKCVERRVMVSAPREIEIPVEPKYESRTKQVLVSEARWEWRWGTECVDVGTDTTPKATQPSPAPPFPVNTPTAPSRNRK